MGKKPKNNDDTQKMEVVLPDDVKLPEYVSKFVISFGNTCEKIGNTLNDQVRNTLYPLFTGLQAYIEQVRTSVQLSTQSDIQDYLKNEFLPHVRKIIDEKVGPIATKYDEQNGRLKNFVKEALPKLEEAVDRKIKSEIGNFGGTLKKQVEKAVGEFIKKKSEKYTSETLEPRVKKANDAVQGKIETLKEKLGNVSGEVESLKKAYESEISNLKKSLAELRALYEGTKISKKPEEARVEEQSTEVDDPVVIMPDQAIEEASVEPVIESPVKLAIEEKPVKKRGSLASMLEDDEEKK